jgi:hypothetical protein
MGWQTVRCVNLPTEPPGELRLMNRIENNYTARGAEFLRHEMDDRERVVEFCVALIPPNSGADAARQLGERCRDRICAEESAHERSSFRQTVTASFGVGTTIPAGGAQLAISAPAAAASRPPSPGHAGHPLSRVTNNPGFNS